MMQDIVDRILETVKKNDSKLPEFIFHRVELPVNAEKTVAFIDGGNAELLSSPDFSLHFIRLYCFEFKNNKKVSTKKNEFYCLTTIEGDKYKVDLFCDRYFTFDMDDSNLKRGGDRVDISVIGGCVRRLLEIEFASEVSSDIVVIDGSLDAKFGQEREFLKKLSGKVVVGLSKTSNELINGGSVIANLHNASKAIDYPWYCNIDGVNYVKFNKNSKYIFKVDFTENVLGRLLMNARDYIFPGYPYGLFLADKFARISNREKDYLVTMLKVRFGSGWKKVESCLKSVNAHDVLDSVS